MLTAIMVLALIGTGVLFGLIGAGIGFGVGVASGEVPICSFCQAKLDEDEDNAMTICGSCGTMFEGELCEPCEAEPDAPARPVPFDGTDIDHKRLVKDGFMEPQSDGWG